ncbi:MAG: hypothetical protein AAGD13_19430 [Pseudomonadota bacterium]
MRSISFLSLPLALLVALSACSSAPPAPPETVDTSYSRSVMTMRNGTEVVLFIKTSPANGVVRVCGAWFVRSENTLGSRVAENILYKGRLYLGGAEIMERLAFLEEFSPDQNPLGQPTACRNTGAAWSDAFDGEVPQAVFPRVGIYR